MNHNPTAAPDTSTILGIRNRAAELGCVCMDTRPVMLRDPGHVVLCKRPSDATWITWRTYDRGSPGFFHGHYDMDEADARADFRVRP